jgi:hypothetical protein
MTIGYDSHVSVERQEQVMLRTLELLREHSKGLPAKTLMQKLNEEGFNPAEVRASNLELIDQRKVTLDAERHFHIAL